MATKKPAAGSAAVTLERISESILWLREQKVMLSHDLALLYGVEVTSRPSSSTRCATPSRPTCARFTPTGWRAAPAWAARSRSAAPSRASAATIPVPAAAAARTSTVACIDHRHDDATTSDRMERGVVPRIFRTPAFGAAGLRAAVTAARAPDPHGDAICRWCVCAASRKPSSSQKLPTRNPAATSLA